MSTALMPEVVKKVEDRARSAYQDTLDPISKRFEFEGAPPASETSGPPMVLLLGNHSSGKSSFINYLVGEDLQRTGIAPVDDGFTIIAHGDGEADKDGETVVTNPKLAWQDLSRFGPRFLSHLKLRQRSFKMLEGLAVIDSPGMIDSASESINRGYDFPAVVRWFAERADVILLLFDPDKPGTTGETLKILTESLAGMEHKLLLVFNKVDRFRTMRDFARAYGALCWNLAKVIPSKDLPHIFTTFLPNPELGKEGTGLPLDDFIRQREEVKEQVQHAQQRRLDNVISRLHQHARRLRLHAQVLNQLRKERSSLRLFYGLWSLVLTLVVTGGVYTTFQVGPAEAAMTIYAVILGLGGAAAVVLYLVYNQHRKAKEQELSLEALFERTFSRELTLGDQADDLRAIWATVKERVQKTLDANTQYPRLRRGELKDLEKVIKKEVPALRSMASEKK